MKFFVDTANVAEIKALASVCSPLHVSLAEKGLSSVLADWAKSGRQIA